MSLVALLTLSRRRSRLPLLFLKVGVVCRVADRRETEWQRRQRRNRERADHVAEFGPACQICDNVPKRGLDQDHDHRTGKTRGWLCHRCNRALPTWVGPGWLLAAALYLLPPGENFAHDLRDLIHEHAA